MVISYGNNHFGIYLLLLTLFTLDKKPVLFHDYMKLTKKKNTNSCIKCIEIENWNLK